MLNRPWKVHLACSLPTLAIILVLLATIGSEREVASFFARYRPSMPRLTDLLRIITDWGNYILYSIYFLLLIRGAAVGNRNLKRLAISFVVAFAVTMLTVYLLKGSIGRARPYMPSGFERWIWNFDYHSFPSGHTTEAILSILPISLFSRKLRVIAPLTLAAGLIVFTRAYLGVHYLSDLVGGLVMGNLGGLLAWKIFTRLRIN